MLHVRGETCQGPPHTIPSSNYAVAQSAAGKSKRSTAYSLPVVISNRLDSEITNCIPTANFPALQFSFDALRGGLICYSNFSLLLVKGRACHLLKCSTTAAPPYEYVGLYEPLRHSCTPFFLPFLLPLLLQKRGSKECQKPSHT